MQERCFFFSKRLTNSIFIEQWCDDLRCSLTFFLLTGNAHGQANLYRAYGHVKTLLFFIGYPRSRHSLLGSLLDAHPHMVIADETRALSRWCLDPNKWITTSIYGYYDTIFHASQHAIKGGRRSEVFEGSVANTTSKFRYYVPNQWQGSFDQYIEVNECEDLFYTEIKAPSRYLVHFECSSRVLHMYVSPWQAYIENYK